MRSLTILLSFALGLTPGPGLSQGTRRDAPASTGPAFADTLASLSAGGRTTCLTTTTGAAYC